MNVLIVTGLSGAGKTRALQILEDMGYYCMDNISPKILLQLIHGEMQEEGFSKRLAVTMDIRSYGVPDGFDQIVDEMKKCSVSVRVLFLDCTQEVLLKRYKESRRLHPLMSGNRNVNLTDAIRQEIFRMESLKVEADYVVDTSELSTSALREKLTDLFSGPDVAGMRIEFVAFGYKYGILADADLVFDVRFLPNPYYVEELRPLTGEDQVIRDYVMQGGTGQAFLDKLYDMVDFLLPNYIGEGKNQLVIAVGCTGGKHRSVAMANALYGHLAAFGEYGIKIEHRDIDKDNKRKQ